MSIIADLHTLADFPALAVELDAQRSGTTSDALTADSEALVWWRCPDRGHAFQTSVAARLRTTTHCPDCAIVER